MLTPNQREWQNRVKAINKELAKMNKKNAEKIKIPEQPLRITKKSLRTLKPIEDEVQKIIRKQQTEKTITQTKTPQDTSIHKARTSRPMRRSLSSTKPKQQKTTNKTNKPKQQKTTSNSIKNKQNNTLTQQSNTSKKPPSLKMFRQDTAGRQQPVEEPEVPIDEEYVNNPNIIWTQQEDGRFWKVNQETGEVLEESDTIPDYYYPKQSHLLTTNLIETVTNKMYLQHLVPYVLSQFEIIAKQYSQYGMAGLIYDADERGLFIDDLVYASNEDDIDHWLHSLFNLIDSRTYQENITIIHNIYDALDSYI